MLRRHEWSKFWCRSRSYDQSERNRNLRWNKTAVAFPGSLSGIFFYFLSKFLKYFCLRFVEQQCFAPLGNFVALPLLVVKTLKISFMGLELLSSISALFSRYRGLKDLSNFHVETRTTKHCWFVKLLSRFVYVCECRHKANQYIVDYFQWFVENVSSRKTLLHTGSLHHAYFTATLSQWEATGSQSTYPPPQRRRPTKVLCSQTDIQIWTFSSIFSSRGTYFCAQAVSSFFFNHN